MFPLYVRGETYSGETSVIGLSSSEYCMIIARVILTHYQLVQDGQTDAFTIAVRHAVKLSILIGSTS